MKTLGTRTPAHGLTDYVVSRRSQGGRTEVTTDGPPSISGPTAAFSFRPVNPEFLMGIFRTEVFSLVISWTCTALCGPVRKHCTRTATRVTTCGGWWQHALRRFLGVAVVIGARGAVVSGSGASGGLPEGAGTLPLAGLWVLHEVVSEAAQTSG